MTASASHLPFGCDRWLYECSALRAEREVKQIRNSSTKLLCIVRAKPLRPIIKMSTYTIAESPSNVKSLKATLCLIIETSVFLLYLAVKNWPKISNFVPFASFGLNCKRRL